MRTARGYLTQLGGDVVCAGPASSSNSLLYWADRVNQDPDLRPPHAYCCGLPREFFNLSSLMMG
ncbi:MAG TPA: hypothetical protein VK638_25245 [Edaphobacter sp.]|nr:hypothetical protein [Edaphobacter sp.]